MRECPDCYGKKLAGQDDRPGIILPADTCPTCRGTGEVPGTDETEPMIEHQRGHMKMCLKYARLGAADDHTT